MSVAVWKSCLVLLVVVLHCGGITAADAAAAKAAAKLILEKGWGRTAAARAVVDECDLDSAALKGDPIVRAGYWLALMHQGRFDPALGSVQEFLKLQPSLLLGVRGRRGR